MSSAKTNIYSLKAKNLQGNEVSLDIYKGKTLLIVNTASNCGFTPQYLGLEKLYQKYNNQGLVILGFPCNQFGNQEPGDEKSIAENCLVNYGVTFPMFSKVNVNGEKTHEIFRYLKSQLGGLFGPRIKWNFTKFLVDKSGNPIKRFSPLTKPEQIEKHIISIL